MKKLLVLALALLAIACLADELVPAQMRRHDPTGSDEADANWLGWHAAVIPRVCRPGLRG